MRSPLVYFSSGQNTLSRLENFTSRGRGTGEAGRVRRSSAASWFALPSSPFPLPVPGIVTSSGFLSSRKRRKTDWRSNPSFVISLYRTSHQLRLDPNVIRPFGQRAARRRLARRRRAHQRLELRADLVELIARKSRARATAVDELAILARADVQRPDPAARAFGLGEPDDDEVVYPVGADLQPVAGAASPIRAVSLLRHDALETELHDLLVQRLAVFLEMLRVAERSRLRQDLAENLLALDERQLAEVVALEREQIEHIQRRRRLDRRALRLARAEPGAHLEHIEVRPPRLVEDDQPAVQNHALERNRLDRARDLRERLRVLEPFARIQNRLAILTRGAHAVTVELHLEQPAILAERLVTRLREHQLGVFHTQRAFGRAQLLQLFLDRLGTLFGVTQLVVGQP